MQLSFQRFANATFASCTRRKARGSKSRLPQKMSLELQALEPRLALAVADTIAPTVKSIAAPSAKTYAAGSTLSFKVAFTKQVVVTGTPTLPITIGDTVRQAAWNGKGSGGHSLVFTTTVQAGDLAPLGVSIDAPIDFSGDATICDKAGRALIPTAKGEFPRARVDAVGPRVTEFRSVTVTPTLVSLQVTFTEPVNVKGKPSIMFTLGGAERQLVYSGGSGKELLTFRYKRAKGELPSAENVRVPLQAISLGSGRVTDKAGNAAASLTQPDVALRWASVGNSRNAADSTGWGSVDYEYRIGTYELTIGQYATFLNAVARYDAHGLYNPSMADPSLVGISQSGAPGVYTYKVMTNDGDSSNRPITYVSWFDAARFANWMHNGQPTGPQTATATEDGAYTLNGATSGLAPAKNAGAKFYIPTEDEWYKAAYYSPLLNSGSGGYYVFATQSDSAPGNAVGSGINQANYFINGRFCVTQASTLSLSKNNLTDVGAFSNSASYYGTFDQSGNAVEWNDLMGRPGWSRGLRGGGFNEGGNASVVSSLNRNMCAPSFEDNWSFGFRLASRV